MILDNIFKDYELEESDYRNIIDLLITNLVKVWVLEKGIKDEEALNKIHEILNNYLHYIEDELNNS